MEQLIAAQAATRRVVHDFLRETDPTAFGLHHEHEVAELEESEPRILAVLRAATLLRDAFQHEIADAVLTARSRGESWSDLATALRVDGNEVAFRAALDADSGCTATDLVWVCTSCSRAIRERCPGAPDRDRERGHAAGCPRSPEAAQRTAGGDR